MINIKFKDFWIFIFIAFFTNIQANQNDKSIIGSILDTCSRSTPVYLWEKYAVVPMSRPIIAFTGLGEVLASEEYQNLGKEAQDALGIPQDKQIPIRKIAPTSVMIEAAPVAFSMPDAIYFNEKNLMDKPIGVKRSAAFVEAVHKKYNHAGAQSILGYGSLIMMSILMCKAIRSEQSKLIKSLAFIGSIFGLCIITKGYLRYSIYRAEVEGHYATKCYLCVQESAAFRPYLEQIGSINKSYMLNKIALEEIAQDLKNQNQLCLCHKNNQ